MGPFATFATGSAPGGFGSGSSSLSRTALGLGLDQDLALDLYLEMKLRQVVLQQTQVVQVVLDQWLNCLSVL